MERLNDTILLVGRILIAALFLSAGLPKVQQVLAGGFAQYLASLGVPFADFVAMVAVAVEVLVPVAIILGVFPRISALLLIAFTVVATLLAHRFWQMPVEQQQLQTIQFFKNIAVIGGLLLYFVSGPGAFSLAGRKTSVGAGAPAAA
jgi:putative oxidoreductase